AAIVHCFTPPRSQPRKARIRSSVSSRSVLGRRCSRGTGMLLGWITRLEPARQPEAVTAGFIGQRNTRDRAAGFDRLAAPALQQRKQRVGIGIELLVRLTLQSRNKTGYQPAR